MLRPGRHTPVSKWIALDHPNILPVYGYYKGHNGRRQVKQLCSLGLLPLTLMLLGALSAHR